MDRQDLWIQVLATDQRAGTEVRGPERLRKGVQIDVAALVAGHHDAPARVVERGESQLMGAGRRELSVVHEVPFLS